MDKQDNLQKGMVLMAEALKQYEEGKFDLAEHSREQANHFFDAAKEELSTDEGIEKAMYGENRNFGIIYHIIEENSNKLYETSEGRKKIGKLVNAVKNNPILMHEFKVYDTFTRPTNVKDPERYVNEAVSVINRYGKDKLTEANSNLIKLVKECGLNENIDIDDETMNLYEAIEYTLLNTPSIFNMKEYIEVKDILRENIERNNQQLNERVDIDKLQEEGVKELTEKYNKELNDDEKRLVEEIASSPKKAEKRFNLIKTNLLDSLKTKIEESEGSDKEGWEHIYETVTNKSFDKETALGVIADMISLKETILN